MSKALQERPSSLPVRQAVEAFALEMEAELKANDHKGGWEEDSSIQLFKRLQEEVQELSAELQRGWRNAEAIRKEAADVANFAMMIADNFGELRPFNNKTY